MKFTTVALSLLTAVSGYTILDSTTFASETKDGIWLVKYYSPTCPWSRRFAPTWKQVSGDLQDSLGMKDIYFGEVDCKANRALCDKADIDGYPTVVLYRNGVNEGEVPGGQSYESLSNFALKL
ncbi:Thioredoxin domain-containing protein 5 [Linderina pennispora]|nr:Thioredoxin domain-containing protein 5 [Linderina pennispora]